MDNQACLDLCLALMRADTEDQVIRLLSEAGYWNDSRMWRYYGDYENNYNTIGNQQSHSEAALVEKLINSIDARLMNECLTRGIPPESQAAPQSTREAVAMFFEDGARPTSERGGLVKYWPASKRTEVGRGITLAATGYKPRQGNPCITIADCGEGQTPEMMPETLLSLTRSNKLRIPFVQGKFNMGGTGVLKFCGKHNLELIVTRRNPAIVGRSPSHLSDLQWGFTVVRREDPVGGRRSSVYTYLAPLDAVTNPGRGGVLRFSADSLPLFPEKQNPYARWAQWGTLIKLYEYSFKGNSHILRKDGLLSRLDILLPDLALPVRLYECRDFGGHEGSFETNVNGLSVRLDDGKSDALEEGFPSSSIIRASGETMTVRVYAFKKGKADTYRNDEGVVFVVNGQTHGRLTTDFFRRKNVGLSYLADSVLVIVDCTDLSGRAREDLFMNSRDRLSNNELRHQIEEALEDLLKNHCGLRDLKERRRRQEIESRIDDSKPLEDVLKNILRTSPTLAKLFLKGERLSTPFKALGAGEKEQPFESKRYPTYFRFRGRDYGEQLHRECHINMKCRITFETDADNDYFSRDEDPGTFSLTRYLPDGSTQSVRDVTVNVYNGVAIVTLRLPEDCAVGDTLKYVAYVSDRTRVFPFENTFTVRVRKEAQAGPGGRGTRQAGSPSAREGEDRDMEAGIALPTITEVYESEWPNQSPPFDKFTALRITNSGETTAAGESIYDFKVNMDNVYLKTEMKAGASDPGATRARFKFALVLMGLALLQDNVRQESAREQMEDCDANIEDKVADFTRAAAAVLLPMIQVLGALSLEGDAYTEGLSEVI